MTKSAPVRLFFPADPRRPFGFDDVVVSLAKICGFERGNKVLVLGFGNGNTPLVLAKELGSKVVAVDIDNSSVERLREESKKLALTSVVDVQQAETDQVTFGKGFHAILVESRLSAPVSEVLEILKPQLGKNGRITLTVPVRVGRSIASTVEAFWQNQLSGPLQTPNEALQALQEFGFEPQTMRVLSDSELSDFYGALEKATRRGGKTKELSAIIQEEIATFRTQGSRSNVSLAMIVGRRREPGEKPPASRSDG